MQVPRDLDFILVAHFCHGRDKPGLVVEALHVVVVYGEQAAGFSSCVILL